ncbi:MAG: nicotinate (nicotinamide) nucleotide adenylyltransferase [Candidatus Pelagibacterales bacterium]
MKIGILGSSFNPPHEGHLKISKEAINIFELDQIWWLITKKNPFKDKDIYLDFKERENKIKSIIDQEIIKLKYFEDETKSNYLIDNLLYIKNNFKNNRYVFLMGSDSFMEIDKWKDYENIFKQIHIAVFNRGSNSNQINNCNAGIEYSNFKIENPGESFFENNLPSWTFISDFNINISSSDIRK